MPTVETNAAAGTADPRAAITQGNARLQEALGRGDAEAIAALYTESAQLLPPNGAPVQGASDIRAFWADAIQSGIKGGRLETQDVESSGDIAVETGRYQLILQPPGGAQVTDEGKYLVMWRRQADGTWKLHRDMFSSNQPPPTVH
jgi:uncharacterized protein (TIGR02246 family)